MCLSSAHSNIIAIFIDLLKFDGLQLTDELLDLPDGT